MLKLQTAGGPDFSDTLPASYAADAPLVLHVMEAGRDPLQQLETDERQEWALLRVLLCAAVATVALAMALMLV